MVPSYPRKRFVDSSFCLNRRSEKRNCERVASLIKPARLCLPWCRLTPNPTLVLGATMMTLTMALIPVCHVLAVLAVVLAIMGFFMGCIDTVSNVYMIRIYAKDVSPFLQVRSAAPGV